MTLENNIEVSIIIPCRNEEKFIANCIDSIVQSDFPKEHLEVLIVDGMSNDRTRDLVKDYCGKYSFVKMKDNSRKIVSAAMNIGVQQSQGEILIRMDAHSVYSSDYISKCVGYLKKYNVDNVGGLCYTLPSSQTLMGRSIALVLSHRFGVGNSYFRIGIREPMYVDTVPFGCYRRDVFARIGLFDEDLIRNQDDEFNLRLKKRGGKILLVPDIISYYYARDTLKKTWKMFFQYGYYKPLVVRKIGGILTLRQIVPSLFIGSLIISAIFAPLSYYSLVIFLLILAAYGMTAAAFSCAMALNKGFGYAFAMPIVFATVHFGYGLGYLKGILDFLVRRSQRKKIVDASLTR